VYSEQNVCAWYQIFKTQRSGNKALPVPARFPPVPSLLAPLTLPVLSLKMSVIYVLACARVCASRIIKHAKICKLPHSTRWTFITPCSRRSKEHFPLPSTSPENRLNHLKSLSNFMPQSDTAKTFWNCARTRSRLFEKRLERPNVRKRWDKTWPMCIIFAR